jgi:hypothetical protein
MIELPKQDGVYVANMYSGEYRVERIDSIWYMSDGTGWKQKLAAAEIDSIISVREFGPPLERTFELRMVSPIAEFFGIYPDESDESPLDD